jgi:hypothetical protein
VLQTAAPVVARVEQAAAPTLTAVTDTAAPLVATATQAAQPLVQAAAPLLQTTGQTIALVTTTVEQTVAPVLDTAQQALAPVVNTTSQVVAPLASAGESLLVTAAPEAATSDRGAGRLVGGPTVPPQAVAEPAPATTPEPESPSLSPSTPIRRDGTHPRAVSDTRAPSAPAATASTPLPAPLWTGVADTLPGSQTGSPGAKAAPGGGSQPFSPSSPFGFASSAVPPAGSGIFVPLVALAAAMLFLAAQRVGRRLRPAVASPRLPILALSLERPG